MNNTSSRVLESNFHSLRVISERSKRELDENVLDKIGSSWPQTIFKIDVDHRLGKNPRS